MKSDMQSADKSASKVEVRNGKRVFISESPGVTLELTEDPEWTEGDTMQLLRILFGPRPAASAPEQSQQEPMPGEANAAGG